MDLQEQINNLRRQVEELNSLLSKDNYSNLQIFRKNVQFNNPVTMSATLKTGTAGISIGDTGEKVAFLGKSPVARHANIADPTGGTTVDTEARTAINSILDVLDEFGFTA